MAFKQGAAVKVASDHFRAWQLATEKAKVLDVWARGATSDVWQAGRKEFLPTLPREASAEMRELLGVSPTPWARLIIGAVSQALLVKSQRSGDMPVTRTFSEVWKASGMVSRQGAIYRSALGHNQSFAVTLPSTRPFTNKPTARITGAPATKMVTFFDADGVDDFPQFAIWGEPNGDREDPKMMLRVFDDEAIHYLSCAMGDGSKMTYLRSEVHNVGVVPVHRFAPHLDLEGQAVGEVEPFIPMLRRLDQDIYDRLVVQRFNSWKVRWIAGMEKGDTDEMNRAQAMILRMSDMLISNSTDTKFGTLDGTDLEPYTKSHDADVRALAAVSQTPPHHLLGQMANLSAEALAAAEASLMRKTNEYKLSFAQTWSQALRSCAFILANQGEDGYAQEFLDEALDYETEIQWADQESRSLSQMADALGKMAEMLKIPVEMLWEQIPFMGEGDIKRAKKLMEDADIDVALIQFLEASTRQNQDQINARPED